MEEHSVWPTEVISMWPTQIIFLNFLVFQIFYPPPVYRLGLADDPACRGCLFVDYLSTIPKARLISCGWVIDKFEKIWKGAVMAYSR
jgi:hypothetical protein